MLVDLTLPSIRSGAASRGMKLVSPLTTAVTGPLTGSTPGESETVTALVWASRPQGCTQCLPGFGRATATPFRIRSVGRVPARPTPPRGSRGSRRGRLASRLPGARFGPACRRARPLGLWQHGGDRRPRGMPRREAQSRFTVRRMGRGANRRRYTGYEIDLRSDSLRGRTCTWPPSDSSGSARPQDTRHKISRHDTSSRGA